MQRSWLGVLGLLFLGGTVSAVVADGGWGTSIVPDDFASPGLVEPAWSPVPSPWSGSNGAPDWTAVLRGQSEAQAAEAQGGAGGGTDASSLAATSQNPVAALSSLPYQMNFNFGVPPGYRTQYIGNLQPVVPLKVSEEWNLITRLIVPTLNQPVGPDVRFSGLGDSLLQLFISPSAPSPFVWGVGPMFQFPTASDPALGGRLWGSGVAAVALVSQSPIVAGALVTQLWTEGGVSKPLLIQPFFNYNFPKGWAATVSGEFNGNWEAPAGDRWLNVLGVGGSKTFVGFDQPMQLGCRFGKFLDAPTGGPDWEFRLQYSLLFPK